MRHFERVAASFDVAPVMAQIDAQPELWDALPFRTRAKTFQGTSDIWLRYRPLAELTEPARFAEPHFASFYPPWHALPAVQPIVFDLMRIERGTMLGGILITRIPPGGRILPHHDRGSWHAEFYRRKIYVPLRTNGAVVNRCEDERVIMGEGEAWFFDNLVEHEVTNDGETERVTLIVCLAAE
jgi:hypothetical protein